MEGEKKEEEEVEVYHERQRLQLCLLHALNNLLVQGRERERGVVFTRAQLDAIATNLSLTDSSGHHNRFTGNYDVNVLMSALESKGMSVAWHDRRKKFESDVDDPSQSLVGMILNVPVRRLGGLWRSRHWLALRKIGRLWYNLDSDLPNPVPFPTHQHLIQFLEDVRTVQLGDIFLVSRPNPFHSTLPTPNV